jgi:uncharacterized coiled-coil protein SlyX
VLISISTVDTKELASLNKLIAQQKRELQMLQAKADVLQKKLDAANKVNALKAAGGKPVGFTFRAEPNKRSQANPKDFKTLKAAMRHAYSENGKVFAVKGESSVRLGTYTSKSVTGGRLRGFRFAWASKKIEAQFSALL